MPWILGYSHHTIHVSVARIALIHVTHDDFIRNRERLDREISTFVGSVKYVYVFIRDSNGVDVEIDRESFYGSQTIYIPNLTDKDINFHSVRKNLREIGYEILHLQLDPLKVIGSEFLERVLKKLDPLILVGKKSC